MRPLRITTPVRTPSGSGFTLIEMAIMLVVFGLVLMGGVNAIRSQALKANHEKAQEGLRHIQSSLLGFVMAQGRLPCPDLAADGNFDGMEDAPCLGANQQEGRLPWSTLQLPPLDPWGHLYTYRVTANVTANFTDTITAADIGDIEILNAVGSSLFTPVPAARPPVLILTHGRNGLGAFPMPPDATSLSTARPLPSTPPPPPEDVENTDEDGTFHLGGDDQMIWIPTTVIRYYVLKSGRSL